MTGRDPTRCASCDAVVLTNLLSTGFTSISSWCYVPSFSFGAAHQLSMIEATLVAPLHRQPPPLTQHPRRHVSPSAPLTCSITAGSPRHFGFKKN
jgi:hypothetical protein